MRPSIIRTNQRVPVVLSTVVCCFLGAACGQNGEEVDDIAAAIETELGGLNMENERELFGVAKEFDEAELIQEEQEHVDSLDNTKEVDTVRNAPEAVRYHVTVLWGQIPSNRDNPVVRDWGGTLTINRGAMLVRSAIAFEPATDKVLPRVDRQIIALESKTRPARDGLRLVIIDPTPSADDELVLSFQDKEGIVYSVAVEELVNEPQSQIVDDLNNRVVVVALRDPVDICDYGFLTGRWRKVSDRYGRLLGRVTNERGHTVGHMRGIFGVRENEDKVFFGKYINTKGEFRGLFAGTYGEGYFDGRWLHRNGEVGRLGGRYWETEAGIPGGGFEGRWSETSCDIVVDSGQN